MSIAPDYASFRARFSPGGTDTDGYPTWAPPVAVVPLTLPTQLSSFTFPVTVTLDASADPTFGVDKYDWYLSQPAQTAAGCYLSCTQPDPTKSGMVRVDVTALGTATWGSGGSYTSDAIYRLFQEVVLYAIRKSDKNVFSGDFIRSLFAQY